MCIAAATAFVELVSKESDNNVKLIAMDRVEALRAKHEHVIDGLAMDILRVLTRCGISAFLLPVTSPYSLVLIWRFAERRSRLL